MSLLLLPILPTSINILFAAALFAGIGNSINLSHHEKSNLGYGWAKRVGELQAKMHAEEFDMNISIQTQAFLRKLA